MFRFTRERFPRLNDQDLGRFAPFIFGPYKKYAAICFQSGVADTLAADIPDTGTPTTIPLSTSEIFARFGASGKVQIDRERFAYTGKNAGTLELTGITRAQDQTAIAAHREGAGVYEVLATLKYCVGENPRLVHFHKGVDVVYRNGRKKAATKEPKHTINLDDRTVAPGRSFVTITFDLTNWKGDLLEDLPPPPPPRRVSVVSAGPYTPPPVARPTGYTGGSPGGVSGYLPPPPRQDTVWTPQSQTTTSQTTTVKEYPAPVIGEIEVDVTGLQDDTVGTITGTPSALIERPAHVTRTCLREAWGERDDANYNLATFTATHALQLADGLRWSLAYEGEAFRSWKDAVLFQGKAHLFSSGGRWHYVYRRRGTPIYTFTGDTATGPEDAPKAVPTFSFTPRTDISTELPVTFDRGLTRRTFLLQSPYQSRYGIQRPRALDLAWIYEEAPARLLGQYWLSQWERQRVRVTIPTAWDAVELEEWDVFAVDTPLMTTWGKAQVTFHALDVGTTPDTEGFAIFGEEADPPGLVLSGRWKTQLSRSLVLSGRWTFGTPPVVETGVFRWLWPALAPVAWDGPWVVIGSTTPPGMFQPGIAQPGMGQEGAF